MLLAVGFLLIGSGIFYYVYQTASTGSFGVVREDVLVEVPASELPPDTLFITGQRKTYSRGEMTLVIPALDLVAAIGESTEPEVLELMPGLYEFSQLPGEGDVNVSIAAHRDIYGMEFYYLDQVGDGDYLYLIYQDMIYRYTYLDSKIVEPTAWEVITLQGFSCLTLTTCDPIGTSRNRLILRAELLDFFPYDEEYALT